MKLHADDFGLNKHTNKAISKLLKLGSLSSTSLLANCSATPNACQITKRFPQISYFIHLNLIEGKPVSSKENIPSLLNHSGKFLSRNLLIAKILTHQLKSSEIKQELLAQLELVLSHGVKITGLDSHQHLHSLSPIAEIVNEIAKEKNIPLVRSYQKMQTQTLGGFLKKQLLKLLAILSTISTYGKLGLPVSWKQNKWTPFFVASWEKINQPSLNNTETLVFHPGTTYDKS